MVTRTRKWKDRQYNGQNKKDKRTNKDLQNTAQNTNDWTIATPLQLRVNSYTPVGQAVISSSVSGTRRVTAKRHDLKILFDTTIILLLSTPEGTVFLHS